MDFYFPKGHVGSKVYKNKIKNKIVAFYQKIYRRLRMLKCVVIGLVASKYFLH